MLRTQFEEELLNLHNQFYEMGMMVSSAVHKFSSCIHQTR